MGLAGDVVCDVIMEVCSEGCLWHYKGGSYSETTWAVGIAQLTHHEVQGGGKNPETEVRGIFATTADRVVS